MRKQKEINVSIRMGDFEVEVSGTDGKNVVKAIISTLHSIVSATMTGSQDCGEAGGTDK